MPIPIAAGFWSYVHSDDEHENGRIVRLRQRLERSIRFYSGIREFRIFLDGKDIGWGQKWVRRLSESLEDSLLLFPVVTPSYFSSGPCRAEALAFQKRQTALARDDLILPIYYLSAELMDDTDDGAFQPAELMVGKLLRSHQYEDWRSLRITEETDPSYAKAIERLAQQATKALKRGSAGNEGSAPSAGTVSSELEMPQPATESDASSPAMTMESASANAHAAPGHVVTLTVSQMPGRAQFTNISDAIARAPGGARIVVAPGHYRESVVVDKPLELIGEGLRDDVVIEAMGPEPLIFDTNIGIVRNFTLRQSQTEGDDYCVWIKQGRLELEDCDISNSNGVGIAIFNGADPRIRRNRIHNCGQSGVLVKDARGTFEDNEVFANSLAGFSIRDASDPTLRRNRVYDGQQGGIHIYNNGRGTYEENEIFSNAFAGITVKTNSNPIVRRNRIYDGKQSGVYIFDSGHGTFEDNDIFGNANAAISVKTSAEPIIRRNRIHNGRQSGIFVYDSGGGIFEDNQIYENGYAGVMVKAGANPVVRRNRIYGGKQSGIYCYEKGGGIFEENDICDNAFSGINVAEEAVPIIRKNNIHNNKQNGIFVWKRGRGTFEGNEIIENARAGILVADEGSPTVHKNTIMKNRYEAVWIKEGGSGVFTENNLTDNGRGAWDIHGASLDKVTRERNRE